MVNLCIVHVLWGKMCFQMENKWNKGNSVFDPIRNVKSCIELQNFNVLQPWLVCGVWKQATKKQWLADVALKCILEIMMVTTGRNSNSDISSVQQITGVKEKALRQHSESLSFCCGKQPQMQMLIGLNKPWRNCWKIKHIQWEPFRNKIAGYSGFIRLQITTLNLLKMLQFCSWWVT